MNSTLIKCHGSSNDFIILDEQNLDFSLTDQLRAMWAEKLCDRQSSIGADGVLFISESVHAQAKMRVFNSDGSEASMCGNGLRCAARYISERDRLIQFYVETMKAVLKVQKVESIFEEIPTFAVEISPITFNLDSLPLHLPQSTLVNQTILDWSPSLRFSALAVPNPHLISFVTPAVLKGNEQELLSKSFNTENRWFTDGVNVSFVVSLNQNEIFVRTYERGVGFTNACGTAMSSSSLISVLLNLSEITEPIDVYNDGGRVRCVIYKKEDQYDHIDLIGNATYNAFYNLNLDPNNLTQPEVNHIQDTDEERMYQKMAKEAKKHVEGVVSELF